MISVRELPAIRWLRQRFRRASVSLARTIVREDRRINATFWDLFAAWLRRWSFESLAEVRASDVRRAPLVAYYQPKYPSLSETFIRREVSALRTTGVPVRVFAFEKGDVSLLDANAASGVTWFGPDNPKAGRAYIGNAFLAHPALVLQLALWIVRCGHESWWRRDMNVLTQAGQLASAFQQAKVTHVHAPWADRNSLVAFVAARLIGARFTVQARASEIHRTISGVGLADRVRFAEFIITNSDYNDRHLRATLGPEAPPVHVIRNGLDLSQFPVRDRKPRTGGPFRILAVGRLVEPKGFKYLLQACRLLVDRGHDVTCDIVGGRVDPMDTVTWLELQLLHESSGLGSRVRFLGSQTFAQVTERFESADAFVLPCVRARDGSHDITPNSLIEAMAMQLPVVSTTSGAIPEIVEHDVSGLLVPPADVESLANAIERLIRDPMSGERLGAAARVRVEERFDAQQNVRERVRLLQSFLALGS
jgi:colanic acid/amylovoran biosynthesis glycosyltransferase